MTDSKEPRRKLGAPLFAPRPQAEVDDELSFHLEQRIRDYVARGLSPEEARREAMQRLGDVGDVRRECAQLLAEERRSAARRDWVGDLRQDLRFGLRSAGRAPLFTMLAIVTLALGIGANAAVFGVVKSVLLNALPYADADRLVRVHGRFLDGSSERGPLSAGSAVDIAERTRSFQSVAAFQSHPLDVIYGGADEPQVAKLSWVGPRLFSTLGVSASLGRTFVDEDVAADTARVVVLAHGSWQRLFGGEAAVIGREIRVNNIPRTVIGVLPPEFVHPGGEADFYFPQNLDPWLRNSFAARGSHFLGVIGRLRPGVTHEDAHREMLVLSEELARDHPREQGSIRFSAMPLRTALMGDVRTPLLLLMASAGLVLLITCANLAGALLSRTLSRRKEFAVRVAMGAGRGRVVRQLLTESTLLAVAGGAAGLLLAWAGLRLLRGLASHALPSYADLTLDGTAVLVTAAVAIATGVVFGLAPALSVGRANVQGTLRDESRGASEGRRTRHLRGMLVAGQIALCVSLLVAAGLLVRSLWAMTNAPFGFDPRGVLTVTVKLPSSSYRTPDALTAFRDRAIESFGGIPGVRDVAVASSAPMNVMSHMGIAPEHAVQTDDDAVPFVLFATVSDEYFQTLRIPLREGRSFDSSDHADAPPSMVISESMARQFWPDGNAIGSRLRMGPNPESPLLTVVGIVGDVRNDPTRQDAEAMAYTPVRQTPWDMTIFLIRTDGDPLALLPSVRRELQTIDRGVPIDRAIPLEALVSEEFSSTRLPVVLMTSFGALALLLASVGVYALFANMAAAREREFGVRIALGASRGAVAGLVLRQGGVWMVVGLLGGAAGVWVVSRLLRGLLYGVAPLDALAVVAAMVILLVAATVALLVPVRRATRVDPITVLR